MLELQKQIRAVLASVAILSVVGLQDLGVQAQTPSVRNSTRSAEALTPTGNSQPTPDWQFRFDLFQMLLEQNGLQPLAPGSYEEALPPKTLIISLGRQNDIPVLRRLGAAMATGRVLIASDHPVRFDGLLEITAGPVRATARDLWYENYDDCLALQVGSENDELMRDVGLLVVNRGGYLSDLPQIRGNWRISAAYPNQVRPNAARNQPLLASLQPWGASDARLFVLADHSLLSNGMIWHGDNAMLAINLSRLLSADGMTNMVFLVDGIPLPSYVEMLDKNDPNNMRPEDIPLPELPPDAIPKPTLEQFLKVANTVVAKVEDSDLINEAIADQPRRVMDSYYNRLLLIVGTILLLTYAMYRLATPAGRNLPGRKLRAAEKKIANHSDEDFATAEERGLAAKFLAKDFLLHAAGSSDPRKWRSALPENIVKSETLGTLMHIAESNGPILLTKDQLLELGKTLEAAAASMDRAGNR